MEFVTKKRKKICKIDMAPLVDIVFLLLIFFMLGSDFTKPSIKIELPGAIENSQTDQADIRISVDKENRIFINKEQTTIEELETLLRTRLQESSRKSVIFSGDKLMEYSMFIKILDVTNRNGVDNFSVEHEKGESKCSL